MKNLKIKVAAVALFMVGIFAFSVQNSQAFSTPSCESLVSAPATQQKILQVCPDANIFPVCCTSSQFGTFYKRP